MIFKDIMKDAYEQGKQEERDRLAKLVDSIREDAIAGRDDSLEEACDKLIELIDGGGLDDDEG